MKKLKLILIGASLLSSMMVNGQVSVKVDNHSLPQWGPVGYAGERYYYLPDIETYYDIRSTLFIYFNGSQWISKTDLPEQNANYDLYLGYKVVMRKYKGDKPYNTFKKYKVKYKKGYKGKSQKNIGVKPKNDQIKVKIS